MNQPLTVSTQDYLKHIYELTEGGGNASTNALSERLNVTPPSVTKMIQKLATTQPALVDYQKHQGVTLTREGERAALEVIRHHRLLETWLVQTLGYSWDEVHEEAERLEHVISEVMERRIAAAMGHPLRDPHGELIPTSELVMPLEDSNPLSALRPKQKARIQCVKNADTELLRYLESLGLLPGVQIMILGYSPFDHNLTVESGEKVSVLGLNISSKIFVEYPG
jgi:DtxR family Mn-dependent transcriptional regulator